MGMLNVLIIDDDRDMRFGMKRIVSRCGHNAFEAECGEQALKCLSENHFDLVFCDLRFPTELSGAGILAAVQANFPDVKVVMMSCGMDFDTQEELLKNGAAAAVQKPFFKADCIHLLDKLFPAAKQAA